MWLPRKLFLCFCVSYRLQKTFASSEGASCFFQMPVKNAAFQSLLSSRYRIWLKLPWLGDKNLVTFSTGSLYLMLTCLFQQHFCSFFPSCGMFPCVYEKTKQSEMGFWIQAHTKRLQELTSQAGLSHGRGKQLVWEYGDDALVRKRENYIKTQFL